VCVHVCANEVSLCIKSVCKWNLFLCVYVFANEISVCVCLSSQMKLVFVWVCECKRNGFVCIHVCTNEITSRVHMCVQMKFVCVKWLAIYVRHTTDVRHATISLGPCWIWLSQNRLQDCAFSALVCVFGWVVFQCEDWEQGDSEI
jgi:hypothetical protein